MMLGRIHMIDMTFWLTPKAEIKAKIQGFGQCPFQMEYQGYTYHFWSEEKVQVQTSNQHTLEQARTGFFLLMQTYKKQYRGCLKHIAYSAHGHVGQSIAPQCIPALHQHMLLRLPPNTLLDIQPSGYFSLQDLDRESLMSPLLVEISLYLKYEINDNKA